MKTNLKTVKNDFKKVTSSKSEILLLDLNEKTVAPPAGLVQFLKKASASAPAYARVAQLLKLKEKIAKYNKVSIENVVVFPGSFNALITTFSLINGPKGETLSPAPTFPFYEGYEKFKQIKVKKIVVKNPEKVAEEIIPAISKTVASVYLVNPGNPFGELFSAKEIEKIILALAKENKYVVIDEAYAEYADQTIASWIKKYDNLIVIKTFSKAFGLSGLRLGYVLANPDLVVKLENLRGPSYTLSGLSIQAGIWSLDNLEVVKKYVKQISEAKKDLVEFLGAMNVKFKPSQANFIAIKVNDSALTTKKLAQAGILVKNLSGYPDGGELTKNWIRITMPALKDMSRLKSALKKAI
ncbi:MAG: histidinol-phosphate transaminase [Candidatus Paceibacterota bacterium]|jgi:histidinol-phosphate aminotransferase